MKRWEFVKGDTIEINGNTLTRIRSLVNQHYAYAGELGGYIQSEHNLPHSEQSWVQGNACVFNNAQLLEKSVACDNSKVFGYAKATGTAYIHDNAMLFEHAHASDDCTLQDNCKVYGMARIHGGSYIEEHAEVYEAAAILNSCIGSTAHIRGCSQIHHGIIYQDVDIRHSEECLTITSDKGTTAFKRKDGKVHISTWNFDSTLEDFYTFIKTIPKKKEFDYYTSLFNFINNHFSD